MPRDDPQKVLGAFYTPPSIVEFLVRETLATLGASDRTVAEPTVLDPACGDGVFLVEVYRRMHAQQRVRLQRPLTPAERLRLVRLLHGVDVDAHAVAACRRALVAEADLPSTELTRTIVCADALDLDWSRAFPDVAPRGGFDVVIGNPPYVDAELMTKRSPELRARCAARYAAASGNWDLFCVFIELAMRRCREGGVHAFVVPNKLASASYAQGARRVLCEQGTITHVRDYSGVAAFPRELGVYPIAYVVRKSRDVGEPSCFERVAMRGGALDVVERRSFDPRTLDAWRAPWPILAGDDHASALVARICGEFPPLSSVADVLGAATVGEAYALQPLLFDRGEAGRARDDDLRVVNSGTIDRWSLRWGVRPMRYLGASLQRPVVRETEQSKLPHKRLEQARRPKLIVAGMSRALEAAVDVRGELLAAKSTTIVMPYEGVDLHVLGAILNSTLATFIHRARFAGDALAGGYLRIGPPQLRTLPVVELARSRSARALDELASLARARQALDPSAREEVRACDAQLDALVNALFRLTDDERRILDAGLAAPRATSTNVEQNP